MPQTCRCGQEAIILEARAPGPNQGRWYWRCAFNACRFFCWDESPHQFIRHPVEAYSSGNTLSGKRWDLGKGYTPAALSTVNNVESDFNPLNRSKTKVVFSLVSDSYITVEYSESPTILPVIKNIDHISWNEQLSKWVIPATLYAYKKAIKALPVNTPNLQIEIEPIPQPIIHTLLVNPIQIKNTYKEETESFGDDDMIDMDVMDRWSKFVESDIYSQLKEFQREGVKCAIERKGRLLIANEKGVGKVDEALAIAAVYRNEWPILVVCPEVLCLTWKYAIQQFFDLDDDEVQHLQEVKANTFNPSTVVKRKKQTTIRRTKKQRQINSQNVENDEEYIVNEEEKEEEEEEVIYKNSKPVQFYVVNHEVATRRRNLLKNVRFKMVICDGTQFVKARGNIHTKAFVTFLGDHPRLIMLSDTASHCLPAELFTGIQAVAPQLVSTFDKFAKRYCDPKQYIFGWIYDGKRNTEELDYILEKIIWHSPKMIDIASQLPRTIYETITAHIKREEKVNTDIDTALSVMEQTRIYMDMYEKTWQAKKKFIKSYFEYISQSFKESKIAIVLYHNEGLTEFKEYFNSKEIKFADVCNFDTIDQECQNFNTTVRIALIDMKLSGLDPGCLCAADIVICCEAPLQRSKAKQIESYFESEDRIGPLFIKYLMAPNTLDDIQWPIPDNTNGYE